MAVPAEGAGLGSALALALGLAFSVLAGSVLVGSALALAFALGPAPFPFFVSSAAWRYLHLSPFVHFPAMKLRQGSVPAPGAGTVVIVVVTEVLNCFSSALRLLSCRDRLM